MKRLTETERKYFDEIRAIVGDGNFPKTCENCGRTYLDELEYNRKTAELDCNRTTIHQKGEVKQLNETEIIFCRNCNCGNLLSLVLIPSSWTPVANAGFRAYIAEKAKGFIEDRFEKEVAWRMALIKFRDEYNQYLEECHHKTF